MLRNNALLKDGRVDPGRGDRRAEIGLPFGRGRYRVIGWDTVSGSASAESVITATGSELTLRVEDVRGDRAIAVRRLA